MEVVEYQEDYFEPLFLLWRRLAEKVPYSFSVSAEKWRECLLEDQLGNEKKFLSQETFIAVETRTRLHNSFTSVWVFRTGAEQGPIFGLQAGKISLKRGHLIRTQGIESKLS